MAFNIKDLNFNVELKSAGMHSTKFPNGNCVGVALMRPDDKVRKYKLRLQIPKELCEKAKITPLGFIMVRLSDCSTAMQIIFEDEQGDKFKGYAVRAMGGYKTKAQLEKEMQKRKQLYTNCYSDLTINFEDVDTKKINKFDLSYQDILHVAKHQIVVDISKLRLYVSTAN